MKSLYSQYSKIASRFDAAKNKALDKLAKQGATEGAIEARNKIRIERRILTGRMIRSTAGVNWDSEKGHGLKIRTRAINDANGFNYSLTQNYGTDNAWGRGIRVEGIYFIEYGRDFVLEKIITEGKIRSLINEAWKEA